MASEAEEACDGMPEEPKGTDAEVEVGDSEDAVMGLAGIRADDEGENEDEDYYDEVQVVGCFVDTANDVVVVGEVDDDMSGHEDIEAGVGAGEAVALHDDIPAAARNTKPADMVASKLANGASTAAVGAIPGAYMDCCLVDNAEAWAFESTADQSRSYWIQGTSPWEARWTETGDLWRAVAGPSGCGCSTR